MPTNPNRRAALADAGLRVLATSGARGLTHRSVDAEARVPRGTTSNYFRTRDDLVAALGDRVFVRLAPRPEVLRDLTAREPDVALVADYVRDVVTRVTAQPELTLALLELRLAATRRPSLASSLARTLEDGYRRDVAFHTGEGLPGGAREVMLLHFAVDGLVLDRLTASMGLDDADVDAVISELVHRIVGAAT